MLLSVDLCGVESGSSDFLPLQTYLQQLVGQPFLHFRFSYEDELTVHFGQPRSYSSPKMKHLVKGSYILGIRASRWFLQAGDAPKVILAVNGAEPPAPSALQPLSKEELESSDIFARGTRIVYAHAVPLDSARTGDASPLPTFGYGLSITLADGSSIQIMPDVEESSEEAEELADWELFTPYNRYLRVGPGMVWSYLPTS